MTRETCPKCQIDKGYCDTHQITGLLKGILDKLCDIENRIKHTNDELKSLQYRVGR